MKQEQASWEEMFKFKKGKEKFWVIKLQVINNS